MSDSDEHRTFDEPDDVIDRGDLAHRAELDILQSWKADLRRSDVEEDSRDARSA